MTTAGAEPGHISPGKVLKDTGEILGKSIGTIWIVALIFLIPVAILGYFSNDGWLIGLIYSIASLIAYLYLTGVMVRIVQDVEADGRVDATVGELIGSISPRLLPLLGLSIVVGILILVGFIFFIIPGIILALMWAVAVPALIAEDRGVFQSMSRSSELTKGNRWRIIGLGILVYVLLFVIFFIVSLFAAITPILGTIVFLLVAIVVYPYLGIIVAVLYFELLEAQGEAGVVIAEEVTETVVADAVIDEMPPPSGGMPPPSGGMPA